MSRILIICTTDSMIWNFLVPHIKELEKRGHYVECACSETGSFFNDLSQKYNIKMNKICFKRTPYSFRNIKAYRQICRIIKEKRFDTIFCHEPVGGAIGRLAGHKMKCRIVYMAHGFHFYKGAPKSRIIYYWVEKWLSKYTDVLITINKEDFDASKKMFSRRNVLINGVGIDTGKFSIIQRNEALRKELGFSKNDFVFLSVGELIKRKNHLSFIKAIAKANSKCFYIVVGTGSFENKIIKMIKKLKLENRVFLLGYRNDIKDICSAADAFVMPSIHEGLSVALMEAMACGKPVIASSIRGNVDLLEKSKGGELVDTFDIDGYVEAANRMSTLTKSELRLLGLKNADLIKKYDIDNIKKCISDLF